MSKRPLVFGPTVAIGLWLVVLLSFATGCPEDEDVFVQAALSAPVGIAVGGAANEYLYVANGAEDTLQIVRLSDGLDQLDFVRGDAPYFPLRIKAGANPTELAATPDGRFVIVLNPVTQSVRLIDAVAQGPAKGPSGELRELALGPRGARPTALVAATAACEAPCLGRFHVALPGLGAIGTLEVGESDGVPILSFVRTYVVGGEPVHVAPHPNGTTLFASDVSAQQVVRLDLETGLSDRRDILADPGALVVAAGGDALVVARPALQDLLIMSDAAGPSWSTHDADAAFGPIPRCWAPCDQVDEICLDAIAPDRALCTAATGVRSIGSAYRGLYLGAVPSKLVALGAAAGHPPVSIPCSGTTEREEWEESVAVVGLDGILRFVGLRREADGPLAATLLSYGWCKPASLEPFDSSGSSDDEGTPLDQFLAACPELPNRKRLACLEAETDAVDGSVEPPGVVVMPGRTPEGQWNLVWEGVIPDLSRTDGGGQITAAGHFTDVGLNLATVGIRAKDGSHRGDILQILTPPRGEAACLQALGGSAAQCALERRIVKIEASGDSAILALDTPLSPACFFEGANIAYKIRVGDQFLVMRGTKVVDRISPGERFGPGGSVAIRSALGFGLRDFDIQETLTACERYDEEGVPKPPMHELLSRYNPLVFKVQDSLVPVRSGYAFDSQGRSMGPAGSIPGAALVVNRGSAPPALFVTYTGSDALLGFVPVDAANNFVEAGNYRVLR